MLFLSGYPLLRWMYADKSKWDWTNCHYGAEMDKLNKLPLWRRIDKPWKDKRLYDLYTSTGVEVAAVRGRSDRSFPSQGRTNSNML